MNQEQLASINLKIGNCDFKGAANEMLTVAKSLSESGSESLSDFLASYAHDFSERNSDIGNFSQSLKDETEKYEKKLTNIGEQINALMYEVYNYFLEFENISILQNALLTRPMFFRLENRDNFPFIEKLFNGGDTLITGENFHEVFKKQIFFYINLSAYGKKSILHIGQRKTNIAKGKYWKFVELSRQYKYKISCLDRVQALLDQQKSLDMELADLRSKLRRNESTAHFSQSEFNRCLELFMAGLATEETH
ncbi:hypothetical protein [Metapseudomonas otitidis]|uniref:hypothetical protein n=1 Tax=Metapseudomonas otitidis TaxID=319939 RepID=UPI002096C479|nr:hypothetical protein [Pseudomonas otitidis]MCO7552427.1 hypothetical protein [Pseudomonas otitidis]